MIVTFLWYAIYGDFNVKNRANESTNYNTEAK